MAPGHSLLTPVLVRTFSIANDRSQAVSSKKGKPLIHITEEPKGRQCDFRHSWSQGSNKITSGFCLSFCQFCFLRNKPHSQAGRLHAVAPHCSRVLPCRLTTTEKESFSLPDSNKIPRLTVIAFDWPGLGHMTILWLATVSGEGRTGLGFWSPGWGHCHPDYIER